jgi:hypothetical protein
LIKDLYLFLVIIPTVFNKQNVVVKADRKQMNKQRHFVYFSLHALKDESYIRLTLQRQAAALHHAAVSYAVSRLYSIIFKLNSNVLIAIQFLKFHKKSKTCT